MGNAKQCNLKELVTVTQFAREAENVGDRAIYSRVPGCCERKWAADRAVTDHGDLTVKIRNRWTETFPDEKAYRRRQGYLPKIVTKINEMPTTFESLVVKRNCSDGQRDRPLYGNFAQRIVSGILSLPGRMKISADRVYRT